MVLFQGLAAAGFLVLVTAQVQGVEEAGVLDRLEGLSRGIRAIILEVAVLVYRLLGLSLLGVLVKL